MNSKHIKLKRGIIFILILIWAIFIFCLSGQNGDESSGLSTKFVKLFIKNNEELVKIVEPYIRKCAHFSEYGVGGILFCFLFLTYNWSDRKTMFTSLALGIWYASLDEIHQLLIDGRNGSVVDVYIDTLGFLTGICFMMVLHKLKNIINTKKINSKRKMVND